MGGVPEPSVPETSAAPSRGRGDAGRGEVHVTEPTRAQQLIARRAAESRAIVPDFTLQARIDMTAAVALRAGLRAATEPDGLVPTYTDLVVKATAVALREHPRANGAYRDGRFEAYSRINIGVMVAAPGVLLTPTLFDADAKPLAELAIESRRLADRVRAGEATSPELSGGTFTISNLGMLGVESFAAVIVPPQAAILAVGAIRDEVVLRSGQAASRPVMTVALTCDHRILYGADGAALLGAIRAHLEHPAALAG